MHECSTITEPLVRTYAADEKQAPYKVAYVMSRFPELTQTFVLFEILAVEQHNVSVELYPLLRGGNTARHSDGASVFRKLLELFGARGAKQLMHPEAEPLVARAHYAPFLSWAIICAQVYYLCRRPKAYFGALWTILRGAWGSTNYLLGGLAAFPKSVYFARLMSMQGISHIHAHFANHPTTAALVVHRLTGIPYSFTAHGSDLHRDRRLLREKVAEAAFVVAISKYNREVIEQHCGPSCRDRLEIVHCGVDTEVFRPADRRPLRKSTTPLQIVSVGTLHEVKGQKYLIEACDHLMKDGIDFQCQFVGEGPDRPMLESLITQLELNSRVKLLGQRTRSQIVELIQNADVLVAPSVPSQSGRREGIPVVLMEAMACGTPVVASDLSGIPELVDNEQSGLLTPPRNSAALASALKRLKEDPLLCRQLGRGARHKVLEQFDQLKNAGLLTQRFSLSDRL
jgi:colanic acid/amylovoran biosynthesis glycosyltransferase